MFKFFIFILGFCLLFFGAMAFVDSEVYTAEDDFGIKKVFNYILPNQIKVWLSNQDFFIGINESSNPLGDTTELYYNESLIDPVKGDAKTEAFDYQGTHFKYFEENLFGYDMPLACGRDRITNELVAVFVDNGDLVSEPVEVCVF